MSAAEIRLASEEFFPITFDQALLREDRAQVITEIASPFRIVHVNSNWSGVCGFSFDEAIGQTCSILHGPGTCRRTTDAVIFAAKQRLAIAVKLVNYTKRGQPFMNSLSMLPLLGRCGEITHLMGVITPLFFEGSPGAPERPLALAALPLANPANADPAGQGPPAGAGGAPVLPPGGAAMAPGGGALARFLGAGAGGVAGGWPPLAHPPLVSALLQAPKDAMLAHAQPLGLTPDAAAAAAAATAAAAAAASARATAACAAAAASASSAHGRCGAYGAIAPAAAGSADAASAAAVHAAAASYHQRLAAMAAASVCGGGSTAAAARSVGPPLGVARAPRTVTIPLSSMALPASAGAGRYSHPQSLQERRLPPFVSKLYELVAEPTTDACVRWHESREAFCVLDPPRFAELIIPRYFKHSKLSSFVQQLSTYGFTRRLNDSPLDPRMEFSHRHFRRDGQDLHLITRGGSAASGGGRRESGASARLALVTTCAQAELAVGEIEATFRQEQAALDAKFAALHRMVARGNPAAAALLHGLSDPRAAAITAMAAANDERATRAALPSRAVLPAAAGRGGVTVGGSPPSDGSADLSGSGSLPSSGCLEHLIAAATWSCGSDDSNHGSHAPGGRAVRRPAAGAAAAASAAHSGSDDDDGSAAGSQEGSAGSSAARDAMNDADRDRCSEFSWNHGSSGSSPEINGSASEGSASPVAEEEEVGDGAGSSTGSHAGSSSAASSANAGRAASDGGSDGGSNAGSSSSSGPLPRSSSSEERKSSSEERSEPGD